MNVAVAPAPCFKKSAAFLLGSLGKGCAPPGYRVIRHNPKDATVALYPAAKRRSAAVTSTALLTLPLNTALADNLFDHRNGIVQLVPVQVMFPHAENKPA